MKRGINIVAILKNNLKSKILLFAIVMMAGNILIAQPLKPENVYPETYTFEKATEYEKTAEYEKAVWFYINLYPDNKSLVIIKIKQLAALLDTVDMSKLIKKSFAVYSTFDPDISTVEDGIPNMDLEKLKKKADWCNELTMKITPDGKPLTSAAEYYLRSIEKYKKKDYNGVIFDLDRAIEMNPSGEYYYNRGFTKSMVNDYRGAIEDFMMAIELKYKPADAYFEMAFSKDMIFDWDGAIADYTRAIGLKNDFSDAYNNRGFVYYKQKNYKKAVTDFDMAIRLNPNYKKAYINRGFAQKDLGKTKEACADWQKALDMGYMEAKFQLDKYCK